MTVQNIENMAQFKTLLATPGLVVVDFSASWCGPCKYIAPKFEELADKETDVTFAKVDVDEADDVNDDQGIKAMPTFKFFKNGVEIAQVMGADLQQIVALVAQHKSN